VIACVIGGIGFVLAMLVGAFAGVDRLILPGFLGLLFCWGVAVWMSERWYRREVREFSLREREVRDEIKPPDAVLGAGGMTTRRNP
jgi:hypothetical protein